MIIFVNGSINAGKSTVASLLAQTLPRTINIEVDQLRHFAGCLTLEQALCFCVADAAELTRRWSNRGFNVVVNWPVSEEDYARFLRLLQDREAPVFAFTLAPRLEVALANRGQREPLEVKESQRIREQYAAGIASLSFGVIIDNSDQKPQQTVQEILNSIGQAQANNQPVE